MFDGRIIQADSVSITQEAHAGNADTLRTNADSGVALPVGAFSKLSVWFDATAVTVDGDGTWEVSVSVLLGSGGITVATSATFTTTGLKELVLSSLFSALENAVPSATTIRYRSIAGTGDGSGTLVGTLHLIYA